MPATIAGFCGGVLLMIAVALVRTGRLGLRSTTFVGLASAAAVLIFTSFTISFGVRNGLIAFVILAASNARRVLVRSSFTSWRPRATGSPARADYPEIAEWPLPPIHRWVASEQGDVLLITDDRGATWRRAGLRHRFDSDIPASGPQPGSAFPAVNPSASSSSFKRT